MLTHRDQDRMANIFKCISFNEDFRTSIKISLKFIPKGPIVNNVGIGLGYGMVQNR